MKRFISLIVAVLIALPCIAVGVSAADGKTQLDVKWNAGWAVISPSNCFDEQFEGDYEAANGFTSTDVFTVPKAGTKLTWTDPASDFATNSVLIISSWKQENGAWVLDRDGAMYVGAGGSADRNSTVEKLSSGKVQYTYTTSVDNENLRLCAKHSGTDIAVYAESTTLKGSWVTSTMIYDTYKKSAVPQNLTNGAQVVYEDISDELFWNYGYVGSSTHTSYKNAIKDSGYDYIYSSVYTIPKAGTTVYVFDDSVYGTDTSAVFSWWKKRGDLWQFDTSKPSQNSNEANQKMLGTTKMFWYTTQEDNENMRFCVHGSRSSDYGLSTYTRVCLVQPVDVDTVTAKGALTAASYTDREGKKVDYSIYLPSDFAAGENVKTLFSFGTDHAVAEALVAAKTDAVVVTCGLDGNAAADAVDIITRAYGLNPHMQYLYGSDSVKNACNDKFCATVSSTAGHASAQAAGEALLANRSDYYGILDGITMYAMGDSYFGGSTVRMGITWVNQMGKKYGMDFINYGIGGSTMSAFVTNKNPMCIRYNTMARGDADLILLEGGRNDRTALVPLGTNDSTDIKTFKGAVNTMLDGMLDKYPSALIVLVTPWYHTGNTSAGHNNVTYANALRELAEYRNDPRVVCLYAADKDATGVNMDDAKFRVNYCCSSSDVSHLNGAGMEMIQPYMEKFLAEALAEYKNLTVDGDAIPVEPPVTEAPVETTPAPTTVETTPATVETTPAPAEDGKSGCGGSVMSALALIAVVGSAMALKKKK